MLEDVNIVYFTPTIKLVLIFIVYNAEYFEYIAQL